jgi:hypothetical protein
VDEDADWGGDVRSDGMVGADDIAEHPSEIAKIKIIERRIPLRICYNLPENADAGRALSNYKE